MMQAQIDLHAALDGREIDGWRISFPRPLYVCKSPAAIVMSSAPASLSAYLHQKVMFRRRKLCPKPHAYSRWQWNITGRADDRMAI
jgi:hypothetical protein